MVRQSRHLPLVLASLLASVALADERARHVYVGGLTDGELALAVGGSPDALPPFIVSGDELLPTPQGGAPRSDEATLPSASGTSGDVPPTMRPDRLTGTTTSTDYYEAFTPAVAPYKRLLAFDAVAVDADGTPVLTVAVPVPTRLQLDRSDLRGPRDAFWGNVVVDLRAGDRVLLPTVSPDARILHLRTEPQIAAHLERDSAGNVFLRSEAAGAGVVRVTFLTDVSRGFFARPVAQARVDSLSMRVPPVPESVRRRGLTFAREIGIEPGSPLPEALSTLVAHFRAFTESDAMPAGSGDTYLDLARSGVGVCRHRAYAFVVTALSLGLPARYVQNEAHAWVEVMLRDGFLRIDLGGGTQHVEPHGISDRPKHEIEADDPFPRPPEFVASLGNASLSGQTEGEPAHGATGEASAVEHATTSPQPTRPDQDPAGGRAAQPDTGAAGEQETELTSAATAQPTALVLEAARHRAYRGQAVDLRGHLLADDGTPVVGGRVEIRVGPTLLGVALTGDDGRFGVALAIPPSLGVGEHALNVSYVGGARYQATQAH